MADSKPTATEPEPSSNLAKSFADRLTFPSDSTNKSTGTNPSAATFTPSKFNWADEVTTPVKDNEENTNVAKDMPTTTEQKSDLPKAQTDGAADDESTLGMAQADAVPWILNGSGEIAEPEFDVNVKLADLQDDPNNPLYSVKSFDELNL